MDEEIKQLQARIQELEQKKQEEEEKNKDPLRYIRQEVKRLEDQVNLQEPYLRDLQRKVKSDGVPREEMIKRAQDGLDGAKRVFGYENALLNLFTHILTELKALRSPQTNPSELD